MTGSYRAAGWTLWEDDGFTHSISQRDQSPKVFSVGPLPHHKGSLTLVIFGVKKKPIVSIEKIGYLLLELADLALKSSSFSKWPTLGVAPHFPGCDRHRLTKPGTKWFRWKTPTRILPTVQELFKNVTNDVLRHLSLSIVLLDEQSFGSSPNKDFSEVGREIPTVQMVFVGRFTTSGSRVIQVASLTDLLDQTGLIFLGFRESWFRCSSNLICAYNLVGSWLHKLMEDPPSCSCLPRGSKSWRYFTMMQEKSMEKLLLLARTGK